MKKAQKPLSDFILIPCWPQLRAALESDRMKWLGDTAEEVARFLIIDGLDKRLREDAQNKASADRRIAATYK